MKKPVVAVAALLIAVVLLLSASYLVFFSNKPAVSVQVDGYTVVKIYPHNSNAFTEGLFYDSGFLYESTGLNGASTLRRVDLTSGTVLEEISLPSDFFGEGITAVNNTIIQLTWTSNVGFIYDKSSFALLGNFSYPTQGWGLTYNGTHLIMSDGSDNLYFLDPVTYQQVKVIQVHDGNASVININELEYVNGDVYANIWLQSKIAIINPETGQVKAWIDLSELQNSNGASPENVLNGIAYDAQNDRLFVTGKDWSQLYEIKLTSK
jgi:glutaminyl-peptide cyclotransferase